MSDQSYKPQLVTSRESVSLDTNSKSLSDYTILISTDNDELREKYLGRCVSTTDSGFDLLIPEHTTVAAGQTVLVNLRIRCEPLFTGGYYLYPRSSIGKTPLRLANSVGIIDNGYRGHIAAWVHNTSDTPFTLCKGERYFQLCHPSLMPFTVKIVEEVNMNTIRGEGGFGSTGR